MRSPSPRPPLRQAGVSLTEILIASAIIAGMIIVIASVIQSVGRGARQRTNRNIARQLAHDRIERLKLHAFPNVWLTDEGDAPAGGCTAGREAYDRNTRQYLPETLASHGTKFRIQTCVEMLRPASDGGKLERAPNQPSTGLKLIVVRTLWPDGPHPSYEEETESVIKDPAGPLTLAPKSGTWKGSVVCTDGRNAPMPCAGVTFYLFGQDGAFNDLAVSDAEGKLDFGHVPAGPTVIRPILDIGEETDPPEASILLSNPDAEMKGITFTITRHLATARVTSDRTDTLFVVTPTPPTAEPPNVALRGPEDPHIYAAIVSGPAHLDLPAGKYFARCWWIDASGHAHFKDPPGGQNRTLESGMDYPYVCHFDE